MRFAVLATVVVACSCVESIEANVIFTLGNNPQPGEENVLLSNGTSGNTVFGTTNVSHVAVEFTSTQTLTEPVSTPPTIEATDGTDQIGLTNFTISVPSYTYGDLIFNPNIAGTIGVAGGTAHLVVTDNVGSTFSFDYTLGSGSNFLTITTSGGESIANTSLQYSLSSGFTDLRQISVSGLTPLPTPEPGSLTVLAALAALLSGREWRYRA